jgi:NAD(P)-dependent dehydrogenase (short-subunit alcohol dehydrogenase family)
MPVTTSSQKVALVTGAARADYHDAIPLNRYGLEEELAEAVFFPCSDPRKLYHRANPRRRWWF